ncbi:hypothetical protein ASG79_13740 [Arthrobacter sp. Soil761]|nr:hypothetical protein ASG79_13740 [Arthrobacter sp. Soil761]
MRAERFWPAVPEHIWDSIREEFTLPTAADLEAHFQAAKLVMKDELMRQIAHELTEIVRNDAKTDWNLKETVRAKLRTRIKRLLLKHGYPPDQEVAATELILQQAAATASEQ